MNKLEYPLYKWIKNWCDSMLLHTLYTALSWDDLTILGGPITTLEIVRDISEADLLELYNQVEDGLITDEEFIESQPDPEKYKLVPFWLVINNEFIVTPTLLDPDKMILESTNIEYDIDDDLNQQLLDIWKEVLDFNRFLPNTDSTTIDLTLGCIT